MIVPDLDSEHYYMQQDDFIRYIEKEVNPARVASGLLEIRTYEARECFRILYQFWQKLDKCE